MNITKIGILSIMVFVTCIFLGNSALGEVEAVDVKPPDMANASDAANASDDEAKASDEAKAPDSAKNTVKLNAETGKGKAPLSRPEAVDPKKAEVAPPSKGGPKTRAHWCTVYVKNYTGWPVAIFMNNRWVGDVGAYGTSGIDATGVIQLTGQVVFTDGTYRTWKFTPVNFSTFDTYSFELYQ